MPAFKDKKRNSWYTAFYYTDWTGKRRKKLKRGFATKKEAQDWEKHFILEKSALHILRSNPNLPKSPISPVYRFCIFLLL